MLTRVILVLQLSFFLLISLFSQFVFAGAAEDAAQMERDRCFKDSELMFCQMIGQSVSVGGVKTDLSLRLAAYDKACEKNAPDCYQMYVVAQEVGKKKQEEVFEKIKSLCNRSVEYCDTLGDVYVERKEYKLALEASKKYFDKHKEGRYIWISYLHGGDKNIAYEAMLAKCRADNSECDFAMSTLPEHPQFQELVNLAENHCLIQDGSTPVANSCSTVGHHYYMTNSYNKALEFYSLACKGNSWACFMIIGAPEFSGAAKFQAYVDFCKGKEYFLDYKNLQNQYCKEGRTLRPMPMPFITEIVTNTVMPVLEIKKKKLRELASK